MFPPPPLVRWSFGVTLWELVTVGGTPYAEIQVEDLYSQLHSGMRMPRPQHCAQEVYVQLIVCVYCACYTHMYCGCMYIHLYMYMPPWSLLLASVLNVCRYNIMRECWERNPTDRPYLSAIHDQLDSLAASKMVRLL